MTDHSQLVKTLEWKKTSETTQAAETDLGWYHIDRRWNLVDPPVWYWNISGGKPLPHENETRAKEAAQADYAARILSALNLDTIDALQARVEALDAELYRAKVVATDRSYMMDAYRAMLGPKGLEVAVMWEKQGVTRQHTSWGPDAWKLSGEDRAGVLLDIEALPKIPSEID